MYKVYFVELSEHDGTEKETYLELVSSEDIYDVYMFIANYLYNNGSTNCFLIPEVDTENVDIVYVDILTIPHYFLIQKILN